MGQNWSQQATIGHNALNVQSVTNCGQNWFKPGNIDEGRGRRISNIHTWLRWVFFNISQTIWWLWKRKKNISCYDPDMTIRNFVCSTEYIQMVVTSISPKLWISMWCVYTVLLRLDLFNSIKSDEPQPSSHLRVESLKYSTARTQHEKSKHKGRHTFPSRNSWNLPAI